jgi:hypothetical protein
MVEKEVSVSVLGARQNRAQLFQPQKLKNKDTIQKSKTERLLAIAFLKFARS